MSLVSSRKLSPFHNRSPPLRIPCASDVSCKKFVSLSARCQHSNSPTTPSVSTTYWNPNLYLQFASERLRPALHLLSSIPSLGEEETTSKGLGKRICDLGCGPGNLTRTPFPHSNSTSHLHLIPAFLKQRWENATIYGIDHSQEMIAGKSPSLSVRSSSR